MILLFHDCSAQSHKQQRLLHSFGTFVLGNFSEALLPDVEVDLTSGACAVVPGPIVSDPTLQVLNMLNHSEHLQITSDGIGYIWIAFLPRQGTCTLLKTNSGGGKAQHLQIMVSNTPASGLGDDITCVQIYEEDLFHIQKRFAMEKISVSAFLLLVALSYTLAKDITAKSGAKKDTKDSGPKLPQTLSRGWGDQLIWTQTYEEALYKCKTSNKPLMIIHHLDECPHSQALKKVFAENKEIQKLAEQFVLLNLVYETTDKHLSPDGQYVPRIMFVDPSLTVRADITGRYSNRLYAYEPSDVALLLDNMKKALKLLKTEL
ncbi:hypothetical protein GH733_013318 [Mirounga leonina]|nr:hypothetical protein GH733_013318 [Mirounga leonina]